jgi:hypothetical protein
MKMLRKFAWKMPIFIVTHDRKCQLFLYPVDESKKFSKIVKKVANDIVYKKNHKQCRLQKKSLTM